MQGRPESDYLTVEGFASAMGMSEYTVRKWIKRRWIRGVMPSGRRLGYRIHRSELERALREPVAGPGLPEAGTPSGREKVGTERTDRLVTVG